MEKRALRKWIKEEKERFTTEQFTEWSLLIFEQIEKHSLFESAKTVFIYYSMSDEVATHAFIEKWYSRKNILLPVVKGDELELRYYDSEKDLIRSSYGIMEPVGRKLEDWSIIDLTIVPGMAFDKECNRMGRGKGFYDRTLERMSSYNIGVCFDFQLLDTVPTDPFDKKMDEVITQSRSFKRAECRE